MTTTKMCFVFLPLKLEVTFPYSKSKKKARNSKIVQTENKRSSNQFIAEET